MNSHGVRVEQDDRANRRETPRNPPPAEDGHRLRPASVRDVQNQPLVAVEDPPIVVVDLHHDRFARDERRHRRDESPVDPLALIAVAVVKALMQGRVDAIGPVVGETRVTQRMRNRSQCRSTRRSRLLVVLAEIAVDDRVLVLDQLIKIRQRPEFLRCQRSRNASRTVDPSGDETNSTPRNVMSATWSVRR